MNCLPREIVTGRHMEFKKHYKVLFGSYVVAHENPTVKNSMDPRTHKWIVILPKNKYTSDPEEFMLRHRKSTKKEEYHPCISTRPINKKSEQLVQEVKNINMEGNYSY